MFFFIIIWKKSQVKKLNDCRINLLRFLLVIYQNIHFSPRSPTTPLESLQHLNQFSELAQSFACYVPGRQPRIGVLCGSSSCSCPFRSARRCKTACTGRKSYVLAVQAVNVTRLINSFCLSLRLSPDFDWHILIRAECYLDLCHRLRKRLFLSQEFANLR